MNTILLTALYNNFVKSLGKEAADNLVDFMDHKFQKDMENKSLNFATKQDLYNTRVELKEEIYKSKVDLIKWFITLWIAQILMILGLYLRK